MTDAFRALIGKVATGAALTREEAANAFEQMMSGEATPSQMGGLLMALRVRGETVEEITGAVSAMRAKMLRVNAPPDAVDIVGTGGDASGSFNISTCAALIVAGADDIDGVGWRVHPQHFGAHGGNRAGDFLDRLAAHAQRHQQAAHLRGRRFARHHLLEGARRFFAGQRGAGRDFADERPECVGHDRTLN